MNVSLDQLSLNVLESHGSLIKIKLQPEHPEEQYSQLFRKSMELEFLQSIEVTCDESMSDVRSL